MTDFLSRLALRSIGGARRVQPIVAPMFAPRRDSAVEFVLDSGSLDQSIESEQIGVPGEPLARGTTRTPLARPGDSAVAGEALANHSDDLSSLTSAPDDPRAGAEAATSHPVASRLVQPSRPVSNSERDAPRLTDVGSKFDDRGHARRRIDSSNDAASWIEPLDPSAVVPEATMALESNRPRQVRSTERDSSGGGTMRESLVTPPPNRRHSGPPAIQASAPAEDSLSARSVGHSSLRNTSPPRSHELAPALSEGPAPFNQPIVAPATTSEPTPSEPTIQVTIGRIEVRATSAAPASRVRRPHAALSLDDYLKQRDRSGR